MIAFYIVLGLVLLLFGLWLFLTAPGRHRERVRPYLTYRYAHRGLHDATRAENSLSAFRAAVEAGYAIELDTRVSKDGVVVVCHDPTLMRVAGMDRKVKDMTAAELAAVDLCGTGEGVPTFAEVLSLVDGRVPLLVEIKEDTAKDRDVSPATLALLQSYRGPYIIESFNPLTLGRVKKILPAAPRGILAGHFSSDPQYRAPLYRLLQHFLLNFIARPQFVAYDGRGRRYLPFRLLCALWRMPVFGWTIRSAEEEKTVRAAGFNTVIFEQYLPGKDTL